MREMLATKVGRVSIGFMGVAVSLLAFGVAWGTLTESDRQFDLAIGVLRAGVLVAAIGLFFAARHRTEIRRQRDGRSHRE